MLLPRRGGSVSYTHLDVYKRQTILQSYTTQMVLLGTALLGLASGIAGTFAVLRKESLIGDGLSHAALPGVVIAFLLTGIKDIEVLIIGAALSSICLLYTSNEFFYIVIAEFESLV